MLVAAGATDANVTTDVVAENATDTDLDIATYTATDPEEEESVTLSLMGDDAGLFELDETAVSQYSPSRRARTSRCRVTGIRTTCMK